MHGCAFRLHRLIAGVALLGLIALWALGAARPMTVRAIGAIPEEPRVVRMRAVVEEAVGSAAHQVDNMYVAVVHAGKRLGGSPR
jgi:hypothetical protein